MNLAVLSIFELGIRTDFNGQYSTINSFSKSFYREFKYLIHKKFNSIVQQCIKYLFQPGIFNEVDFLFNTPDTLSPPREWVTRILLETNNYEGMIP